MRIKLSQNEPKPAAQQVGQNEPNKYEYIMFACAVIGLGRNPDSVLLP